MTTMIAPLKRAWQVAPERTAIVCGDVRLSHAETWQRCRRLAGALHGLGLQAGDPVAVVGPNCHRYLELYQAVPGSGMALVPLNQRHSDAELRYALEDSGARVLFAGRPVADTPACVEHVIDLGEEYERLLAGADPADFPAALSENALAGLFYTGGTTGAAKGVMLTHRNLVANALHFQACWQFGPETCWLIVAPSEEHEAAFLGHPSRRDVLNVAVESHVAKPDLARTPFEQRVERPRRQALAAHLGGHHGGRAGSVTLGPKLDPTDRLAVGAAADGKR